MTEIQRHILTLVKEIDQVCREQEIGYILHGQTAGCTLKNGKFKTGAYPFHIIIAEKDMNRLAEALSKTGIENREIEKAADRTGMDIIRYVDSATCIFDRKEAISWQCSGAAVTIHPFCEKKDSKKGLFGRLLGKKLPETYDLEMSPGEYCSFPAECLTKTKRIRFEDTELPLSENSSLFFECFFGPDWKEHYAEEMQSTNSSFVIWDAQVSYREYLKIFSGLGVDITELFGKIRSLIDFVDHEYAEKQS